MDGEKREGEQWGPKKERENEKGYHRILKERRTSLQDQASEKIGGQGTNVWGSSSR